MRSEVQFARVFLWLVAGVVAVSVIGAGIWLWTEGSGHSSGDVPDAHEEPLRRAASLSLVILLTFVLFLAFLIGSYLIVRTGRHFRRRRERTAPTEYVDAWSSYRLSDEEIARATDEGDAGESPLDDR